MQLVATLNGVFFRAISVNNNEVDIDKAKQTMLQDQVGLKFEVMTNNEFELWLDTQVYDNI